MTQDAQAADAAVRAQTIPASMAPLTRLIGRDGDAVTVTSMLARHRLVTVTGPGGVGKTRLAAEVARSVAGEFPDGVWFIDLSVVSDGAQVADEVTAVLGVQQDPGRSPVEVLALALVPLRLLLILDNCEHLLPGIARLCGMTLTMADEVRVLATSRERIGITGEAVYRLLPLELPGSGEPRQAGTSAAEILFTDRATQADPRFTSSPEAAPLVAHIVTQLDGMPLAIELAAARAEALGLAGLASRIDDAMRLLTVGDPLAASRHQSLAGVAEWSYQLLAPAQQQVFRRLGVFPGAFTLDAAEAVAGPDAGPVVLRLVDCSLLVPPQPGGDQRMRYTMLQVLRAYARTQLASAGEERQAAAALAAFACQVAGQAAAAMARSDGELAALRWLDAEDALLNCALTWTLDNDRDSALRLACDLAPWLFQRGRLAEARARLHAAARAPAADQQTWASAQLWLGYLASYSGEPAEQYSAAIDAFAGREPSAVLVEALAHGRAIERMNHGETARAVADSRRALALARELRDAAAELLALTSLSATSCYSGDADQALLCARQALQLLPASVPGAAARWSHYALAQVLAETGELEPARQVCAAGLSLSRETGDLAILVPLLGVMTDLDRRAGDLAAAGTHLAEAVSVAARIGHQQATANMIEQGIYLCAETGRWADAATLAAALEAEDWRRGHRAGPVNAGSRARYLQRIGQQLPPGRLREASERGARMPLQAAAELTIMVSAALQDRPAQPAGRKALSPRERELITLVAQGHTNAQIAGQLFISVRTVASHLDRIRDKTGCRRRADLTRLAVQENLV